MSSHGVEISIAGGGADEKDEKEIGGIFLFFFYIIYSLLRDKKSHGALAMAKTKPKTQNELTKEKSGPNLFSWGPYRSQAHTRARHYRKYDKGNPPYTSGQHEKSTK